MQFIAKSGLTDYFANKARELQGKKLKATLQVGEDAKFWKYLEYGTGTRRAEAVPNVPDASEFGVTGPGEAYEIHPHGDYPLRFPDPENKYNLEHDDEGFALAMRIPASDDRLGVSHPGIAPLAFVRKTLFAIAERFKANVKQGVENTGVSISTLEPVVVQSMEQAKQLIVESLAEEAPNTRPDGRLKGRTAAEVFNSSAHIVINNG